MLLTLSDLRADRGSTGQRLSSGDTLLSAGIFFLCFLDGEILPFSQASTQKNARLNYARLKKSVST